MKPIAYIVLLFLLGAIPTLPLSEAATRTAHFTQSGRNVTEVGLGENATSNCRITLANASSVSQNFSLSIRLQVTGTHANSSPTFDTTNSKYTTGGTPTCGVSTDSSSGTTASGSASHARECSGTLAPNVGVTFAFNYPTYSKKADGTTAGVQTISCSGTITASDPTSSNPGFLLGTGNLTIFSESGELETDSTTGGGTIDFGGQGVFSQIPIAINRSKPF